MLKLFDVQNERKFELFLNELKVNCDSAIGMARNSMPATETYLQFMKAIKKNRD